MRKALVITSLVLFFILGVNALLWSYVNCTWGANKFLCYESRVNEAMHAHGISGALAYAFLAILPLGPGQTHLLMHVVGETVYEKEPNISKMEQYLSPYTAYLQEGGFMGGFDGFFHGYLSSYLRDRSKNAPFITFMDDVCKKDSLLAGIPFGCYHVFGHVLMDVNDNVVAKSLQVCDTAGGSAEKNSCYSGVFMENAFLYDKDYHPEDSRPDAVGTSMAYLCTHYDGEVGDLCTKNAAISVLLHTHNDFKAAFELCASLSQFQNDCAFTVGSFLVTPKVTAKEEIGKLCTGTAPPQLQHSCMQGADSVRGIGASIPVAQNSVLVPFGVTLRALETIW